MTEPRHRKLRRKKGIALRGRGGRRRASGVIEGTAASREELNQASRRRSARLARRRIAAAVIVALGLVAGSVAMSVWLRSRPDPDAGPEAPVSDLPEGGSSVLAMVLDDTGRAVSIALVAAHPEQQDRVVLFHPSLLVTIPGFGENLLALASRFGGEELADTTVTNLIGARVDAVLSWTEEELAAGLGVPLTVDLPIPLLVEDGTSFIVAARAGLIERGPEEAARLLAVRGMSDELDHLRRQGGVWRGILEGLAGDAALADRLAASATDPNAARQALVGAATGEPVVTLINASRIDPTGGGEEWYQLDGRDAATFLTDNVPYLQLAAEPRYRVEVLNGNGLIGTTRPVAAELVDAGFRVVITDNADRSDYAITRIVAHGRQHQDAALAARDVVGRGDVSVEVWQPSGVVDVTIIVGQDLPAGQR